MRVIGFFMFVCIGISVPWTANAASDSMAEAVFPNLRSDLPPNNMSEQAVLEKFGEPAERIPPVGNPPISRWKYPEYIVYYEWDRVIIAVPYDLTSAP